MANIPYPYKIISVNSGKVLNVSGASLQNGAPIIQYDWVEGASNEIWYFDKQGTINLSKDPLHPDGPIFEVYKIRSHLSGKVLDVSGASITSTEVIQFDWWGGANQLWYFCPIDAAGTFLLKSALSTKVLDVNGASQANGAKMIVHEEHRGPNQLWRREQVQVFDLAADFVTNMNLGAIKVAAVVENVGTEPVAGPFGVNLTVGLPGVQYGPYPFEVPQDVTILPGKKHTTQFTEEWVLAHDQYGNIIPIEMNVWVDVNKGDMNGANNHLHATVHLPA